MIARTYSSSLIGIDAHIVEVEVDITNGLPTFILVGLPEASVRESRERVKSAVNNSGFSFPDDRITVNLAPADIKKEGTGFDLPIAIGILSAAYLIPQSMVSQFLVTGELSLDGEVKPIKGALSIAIAAKERGYRGIILPYDNRREASVVEGILVYPIKHLSEAVGFLKKEIQIEAEHVDIASLFKDNTQDDVDFSEVMGQEHVKRALEIAAAGGHNVIMIGPPGAGKTMLARRIPSILPDLTFSEAIETTRIFSVAGMLNKNRWLVTKRPFRSPHHTISDAGLIGGGHIPRPGEVSLAHNGVLFLDELSEFKKHVLEVLRQPLEDNHVTISRAASAITYPAGFMLVAAMNPCPCGYFSDPKHECRCTETQMRIFRSKVSGPLMDRIDIHVEVPPLSHHELRSEPGISSSATIRTRVAKARRVQSERFDGTKIYCNAQMGNRHIRKYCLIDLSSSTLLETAMDRLGLSARAFNRILKISRTIADLDGKTDIGADHVAEAIQYRSLDRKRLFL